ncbi:MAG: hypothetical protein IPM54_19545 [Polyangiaceae bacterium]|nr:hypothetical protein [Polyangiaceae bacterium]
MLQNNKLSTLLAVGLVAVFASTGCATSVEDPMVMGEDEMTDEMTAESADALSAGGGWAGYGRGAYRYGAGKYLRGGYLGYPGYYGAYGYPGFAGDCLGGGWGLAGFDCFDGGWWNEPSVVVNVIDNNVIAPPIVPGFADPYLYDDCGIGGFPGAWW